MFSSRFIQNFIIFFLLGALTLGVIWADIAGVRAGKSEVILKNTDSLKQGLALFYTD